MSDSLLTEYGRISRDFSRDSLANLCVEKIGVQTGPFGSQLHNEDYVEAGTPIITVEHLGENRILHQNTPFVSDEDRERLSKYHLQEGDIVFSRVGSVDRRALVRKEEDGWLFSGRCLRVRVDKDKIDPLYLSYFFGMEGFKNYIRSIAVGATMPSINTKILSDVPIYYPDLDTQRKIAEVLYSIDEKIERNRQTNQTLEQIAQAIFKSWFVDFDPVRAKIAAREAFIQQHPEDTAEAIRAAAGTEGDTLAHAGSKACELAAMCAISGKTEEQLNELDAVAFQQLKIIAALFPDSLEDTALGELPEGWCVKPLSKLVELIGGGTPTKSEEMYWGGDIPWFSVKDAPLDGDVFVVDTEEKITESGLRKSSTKMLSVGTTIISARGTVGRLALVGREMAMNQSCYGVKGANGIGPYLNYFNLKEAVSDFRQNTHGAVFDTITRGTFDTVMVAESGHELNSEFEKLVSPMFEKIKNNLFESAELTEARNALLPKLLSGEVCLKAGITE